MSAIYSFLFIFTSNHIEFLGLLSKPETLNSPFWNEWSEFIRAGNMKYIGYLIILLTIIIFVLALFKKTKNFDEYQISILSKSLIVAGLLSILMIPIIMILILSDTNYTIATMFLFVTIQWVSVLIVYLIYILRN
jgi:hypothetical protein